MIVLTNIDKASTMFKALLWLLGMPVNKTGLSPVVWWMRDRQIMISDMENARQRGETVRNRTEGQCPSKEGGLGRPS